MGEGILLFCPSQIIQQAKFTYSDLGKAFEEQTENQVDALKFVNLCNKRDELKPIESVFTKTQAIDLIIGKLKEIVQLQNYIKLDHLEDSKKRGKLYNFSR